MKELTIEQKAKAYDEAYARMSKAYNDNRCSIGFMNEIFPRPKESENEKIRKELIEYIKTGTYHKNWIAWLEKQGAQKSIWHNEDEEPQKDSLILLIMQSGAPIVAKVIEPNHTFNHGERWAYIDDLLEKQGEKPQGKSALEVAKEEKVDNQNCVKPVDKDKPKFNEGDWIVHHGTENIYQVVAVIGNQYQLKYGDNYTVQKCADVDRCARLWDITKDAKDGDVLCYKDEISLYKHDIINYNYTKQEKTFDGFVYYCCYDGKGFIVDNLYSLTEQDKIDIRPATKEQRDTLERAITNAGYIWYAEKKKLKKIIFPRFKIGDTIAKKRNSDIRDFGLFTITNITDRAYWYNGKVICDITEQDDWELL